MAITMKYNTYKVYPRVYYFQRLLLDLYQRFVKLTDCFQDEAYHNRGWLECIKDGVERYKKSLSFKTRENSQFDMGRVLLYTKVGDAPKEENGMQICICYLKIDYRDQIQKEEAIQDVLLPFFKAKCCEGNSLESFFVVCDVDQNVSSGQIDQLHTSIHGPMERLHSGWKDFGGRIIICSDKNDKTAATVISKTLETDIQDLFSLMLEYLQRFTGRHEGQTVDINILDEESCMSETLSRFVNDILALNDMRKIDGIPDDEKDESSADTVNRFAKMATKELSRNICQSLPRPLISKYDLKPSVADTLISETDLQQTITHSLMNSLSVQKDLKKLEKASREEYVTEYIQEQTDKHGKTTSNHNKMIPHFLDAIRSSIDEFETCLKKNLKIILEMKRMKFEIESYMRQSSDPQLPPRKEPTLTKQLAKEIQNLDASTGSRVLGVGIFYGTLQIQVKEDAKVAPLTKELYKVMKKHQYWYPYKVCRITKDAVPLMHSTGSKLKASLEGNKVRLGTVGAFMHCHLGNLYAITAAHVVGRPPNDLAESICLVGDEESHRIGTPHSNTTVNTLVDIAAIKVSTLPETAYCCHLKDMEGSICNGIIYQDSPRSTVDRFVTIYKHGAQTGLTKGIIASTQCVDFSNNLWETDCILVCQSQPNAPSEKENFATCGDSGALVCAPGIEDPDTENVLSMLTCGDMHVKDGLCPLDLSCMYFSVMFRRGLEAIKASSGLQLSLRDQLPVPQLI